MKSLDFLSKLKKEGKLELVENSEEISLSYEKKSIECRQVAKLAFDNKYFESAITQSYYSMYNNVLSLFFKCGIKCENHTAAVIILRDLFNQNELYGMFSKAKKERIDKQYYTTPSYENSTTKDSAIDMIKVALKFNPLIISLKNKLKIQEITNIRDNVKRL
jgi:uncharacterized protein (UPF0332 family)